MAKPNRLDVVRATGEMNLPTKQGVAETLEVETGSQQFEQAFGKAVERGLVEPAAGGPDDGTERWSVSAKGKRKLASAAE